MEKDYSKYVVHQDYYKYGNWPNSYYSFPVNALHTDKYNYQRDISHLCEDFTPDLEEAINAFFEANPRCWYCVVKDVRFFYKNIVMRKLMHFKERVSELKKYSFKITKIEEVSKSSCALNIRERRPVHNKKTIDKILRQLYSELDVLKVKTKVIRETRRNDCYSLKLLVSKK